MSEDTRNYKPVMTADEFRAWLVMTLEFLAAATAVVFIWPNQALWLYIPISIVLALLVRGTFSVSRSRAE